MCVILEKLENKEVPYEHLLAGAHRNPDGYGVMVHDRGKIEVIQGLAKPEEAATKVNGILEQAKGNLAYAHFRFRTVGEISEANTHPMTILTKDKDGVDLKFMHNGTLDGFRDTVRTDSMMFADQILSPLARRSAHYLGPDEVIDDPLIADVLKKYAGSISKFALLDGNGNSMIINRTQGEEQDYGWASNSYSIAAYNIPQKTEKVIYSSAWPRADEDEDDGDFTSLVHTINGQRTRKPLTETAAPSIRMTFEDITGLKVRDTLCLDSEQIRELVDEEPDLAAILIMDLQYAVYGQEVETPKSKAA